MSGPMTNYNERLCEIVLGVYNEAYKCGVGARPYHEYRSVEAITTEAKEALTSITKELVAEAKPGYDAVKNSERDKAIDEFEQNLLKALEDK